MKYSFFITIFVLSLFLPCTNEAQTLDPKSSINVGVDPSAPKANEDVHIDLTSYLTDINKADISWIVNGKISKRGVGEKSFILTVGDVGTKTTLNIVAKTLDGSVIEKTIVFKPTSVDLVWQSEGLVPPFYKGKALFSHQNKLSIVALPHIVSSSGQEINPKSLIYTWKKNGSVVGSASGFGKNVYTFVGPLISRSMNISVEVSTLDTEDTGFAIIGITPTEPSLIIYKKDPLYGIEFQKAFQGSVNLNSSKELTLIGFPLFFGTANIRSDELVYKWAINGVSVSNPNQPIQVFRQKEGTSGTSNISLSVENSQKILQYTSSGFNLTFSNNN